MPNPAPTVQNVIRTLTLIWVAFMMACLMYVGMCQLHPAETSNLFPDFSNPIQLVLTVAAVSSFAISALLPRVLLGRPSAMSDQADAEKKVIGKYFISKIIAFALSEAVCLFGFVMAFTSHANYVVLPFATISVVAFLMNRPSENELRDLLRRSGIDTEKQAESA